MAKPKEDDIAPSLKKQIDLLKKEKNEPLDEQVVIPIIENKIKRENKPEFIQYKIAIPQKFAYEIGLSNKTHVARLVLSKPPDGRENRLTAEFVKKEDVTPTN